MPRTSRFSVTFNVNGHNWVATFDHKHSDEGVNYDDFLANRVIKVRHITRCKLSAADKPGFFVPGVSLCSLKDTYDWRKGIKQSLQRALAKAGLCEEVLEKDGIEIEVNGRKHLYKHGDFISLKGDYSIAMASFFEELPKKDYAPHNGVQPTAATSEAPADTASGTYHLGAD